MNLIRYLEKKPGTKTKIVIISTKTSAAGMKEFKTVSGNVNVIRFGRLNKNDSAFLRLLNYGIFYICSLLKLLSSSPQKILYYETLSSFPVFVYKKYFNAKVDVLIHYHEYTSPAEYLNGMRLVRYFHKMESYLYPKALWISQTNNDRLNMFIFDEELNSAKNVFVLPNYPPQEWQRHPTLKTELPLKIVYVGALSLETMYTKEFVEWVRSKKGIVSFDIFSSNITNEARAFILAERSENINLHEGIDYFSLPEKLPYFNVGIILYKGHIPNYIYNAPNKLFEYLSCGLDVWYPSVMKGCEEYNCSDTYPKVIPIDFMDINRFDFFRTIVRDTIPYKPSHYYCEMEFEKLTHYLLPSSKIEVSSNKFSIEA